MKIRTRKGTTLLEIMVAALIFSLALSGVLGSMAAIVDLIDLARDTTAATADLRNMMERVRATPFALVVATFPDGVADGPGENPYAAIVGGYGLIEEHITATYADPDTNPLEIRITADWQDKKGHGHSAAASTFKAR